MTSKHDLNRLSPTSHDLDESATESQARIREVPAVRRAVAILQLLSREVEGMNTSHIARELGLVQSTCLHILRELANARLVSINPVSKVYRLGYGVLNLASAFGAHDAFISAAQPRLARFAQEFSVSATAQQRDGNEVMVLAAVAATEGLVAPVGRRSPVLSGSGGQLLAGHSNWSEAELRVRFDEVRWQNKPEFDTWLAAVRLAKVRGYAIDDGQRRLGITSISAPIPDRTGEVTRTISVNMVSAQVDETRRERLIRALQSASADIVEALR